MTKASAKAAEPDKAEQPKRPERSQEELGRMLRANERRERRHEPVTADVKRGPDGRLNLDVPHDDHRGWLIRLGDAMGTRSDKFAMDQVQQLLAMIPAESARPDFDTNAMLAGVDAVRPENEIEGQLAVQMAATHYLAMAALARSSCSRTVQGMEANGNLATKMLRTYTAQLEALAKLRRGGSQKVTVEHVHVYEGGQAIVGNVDAGGRPLEAGGRGRREREHQAHAADDVRALALAGGDAMRGADPLGEALRGTGREREVEMPDARRGRGKRRSAG